jgi:hypothetical protein
MNITLNIKAEIPTSCPISSTINDALTTTGADERDIIMVDKAAVSGESRYSTNKRPLKGEYAVHVRLVKVHSLQSTKRNQNVGS